MLERRANPILERRRRVKELAAVGAAAGTLRTTEKHIFLNAGRIDKAVDQIKRLPAEGETIHAIMSGAYNAWDLVPAVMALANQGLERLTVTTLGFNLRQARQLAGLIDAGEIKAADFICSTLYAEQEKNDAMRTREILTEAGAKFAICRNHSKILLMHMNNGARLVSESSANFRTCRNVEQFALSNHRELYDFHRAWIEKMLQNPAV